MSKPKFTIITGLSGSGKSYVHNCLEDLGYFCVDNLPLGLVAKFFELATSSGGDIGRVAIVLDIRDRSFPVDFGRLYDEIRQHHDVRLVFLEASDEVLARRFSETRRPHPLAGDLPLMQALRVERDLLEPVRSDADFVVDTSRFNVHELRDFVRDKFGRDQPRQVLVVSVVSFGFKYGVPTDSDLVFDVRFLANPHFDAALKPKTGLDPAVVSFVLNGPGTEEFMTRLSEFVAFLLPHYLKEGKSYLSVAIGCTGGKHRSVVISNELGRRLKSAQYHVNVRHRDIERP